MGGGGAILRTKRGFWNINFSLHILLIFLWYIFQMWEGGGGGERSTQAVQHVRGRGGGSQAPLPPLLSHHRLIASRLLWSPVDCCDRQSIDVIASQSMWSDRQSIVVIASQLMWSPVNWCDRQSTAVNGWSRKWTAWIALKAAGIASHWLWSQDNVYDCQQRLWLLINSTDRQSNSCNRQSTAAITNIRLWSSVKSCDHQYTAVIVSQSTVVIYTINRRDPKITGCKFGCLILKYFLTGSWW